MGDKSGLVMQGSLNEFKLHDVLQVVGMSRQFTVVELKRQNGNHYGTIWIKAGRVIGAERGEAKGRFAFYEMFGSTPEVFVVSRLPDPPSYDAPIGSLTGLLVEAVEHALLPEEAELIIDTSPAALPPSPVRRD